MTRQMFRSLAVGTLVMMVFSGNTTSQTRSPILNTLELQKLVGTSAPADNARLGAHFAALADVYAADATRHNAMALAFIVAPTRRVQANAASDHCKRLARLNEHAAKTLRQLATYHEGLAGGEVSTPPRDAARFHRGEGAPEPTSTDLSALAAKEATKAAAMHKQLTSVAP